MNAIEINSLTKKFKKSVAIDNISLNVEEGEIFGFLDRMVLEKVLQ